MAERIVVEPRRSTTRLDSGYRLCAPEPGLSQAWTLRGKDGALVAYFVSEAHARAYFEDAGAAESKAGPVQPQDQEARLAAARYRITWLSQQLLSALAVMSTSSA